MLKVLTKLLGSLFVLVLLALTCMYLLWGLNLPQVANLDVIELGGKTRVYDRTGKLIGTLRPSLGSGNSANHDLLTLKQISPFVLKSVVTSEDRRFYSHFGIDPIGIGRGVIKGILKNDLEGGSSITQQVIKNTLLADLNNARTAERKFKEAVLALRLEKDFSKNQILNAYLNVIYWGDAGQNIMGIGGAARAYFYKEASQLSLPESVYLATLIPAPNRRYREFAAYRPLMRSLLNRMVADGQISQAEADKAWRTPIYPAGWRISWKADGSIQSARLENPSRLRSNLLALTPKQDGEARGYLQVVEKELAPIIPAAELYGGGKIYTGMDLQAQRSAEAASRAASLPRGATLGLAMIDKHGELTAVVGQSLRLGAQEWNNALQAKRQVGSSIKPLLYTLAISRGWKQSDTVPDVPLRGNYRPTNYNGRWSGRSVTLRYALNHSLNLPTVRMAQAIGIDKLSSKLTELGLEPEKNAGLSLSIGTLEASPIQMAAAYVPFMNGGIWYQPHAVRSFEDRSGRMLYGYKPVSRRVWDAQTAWIGLDMIRGVVDDLSAAQGGLATKARIRLWEVGGKTGTTNDIKDLWFVGVTPMYAGAVWVGKEDNTSLPSWAYSGEVPTPIWREAMSGALKGKRADFDQPSGMTYRVVRRTKMAFRTSEADSTSKEYGADPQYSSGSRYNEQERPRRTPQNNGYYDSGERNGERNIEVNPVPRRPRPTPPTPAEPEPLYPPEAPQPVPTPTPAEPEPIYPQYAPYEEVPAVPSELPPSSTPEPLDEPGFSELDNVEPAWP